MPRYAIAIAAGMLLAFYGNRLPDPLWSAYAPLVLLLAYFRPGERLLLLGLAAYLSSAACFDYQLQQRLPESVAGRVVLLQARIAAIPLRRDGYLRLDLDQPRFARAPRPQPRRLRVNWYQDQLLPRAGERWQLEIKLRPPRGRLNPGVFDYERWLLLGGIDALGYVRDSSANRRLQPASPWYIHGWRGRLSERLGLRCEDCRQAGLIKALALGFRGEIDAGQRRALQASGTAHLLAISGLHIGLVALLALTAVRYCWRGLLYRCGIQRDRCAALAAISAAAAYAALAGFSLPTQRALAMLVLVLLALVFKSRVNLLQALAIAAILILCCDPLAIGSASFWLSLGALLVIALAQPRLLASRGWWRQLVILQLYFTLLFAPLGLLIFGQLNPASFAANLVAIPLVSFLVLPLVLLGCLLLAPAPGLSTLLLQAADRLLGGLLEYLRWLQAAGLDARVLEIPVVLALMCIAALAWLLQARGAPGRWLALVVVSMTICWQPRAPRQGEFEALFLDVGQGTSILLRTRRHSLVYDFGPGRAGGYSAAEWALLPQLQRLRLGQPDLAVISHADQDHSGGLSGFLQQYPQTALLTGTPRELAARYRLRRAPRSCHGYPAWRWDGVDFAFVGNPPAAASSNNRSCVLLVRGFQRLLLAGDIEAERELELLERHGSRLDAEILLVPHHGSATSSSAAFIERVDPRYAVFTLGRGNRWGFPAEEVVKRYQAGSRRLLRSDRDGAVTLTSSAGGLALETLRHPPRRIWRRW